MANPEHTDLPDCEDGPSSPPPRLPPDAEESSPFLPTSAKVATPPARVNGRPRREQGGAARTLPHSIEAEEALLSCCLIDEGATLTKAALAGVKPDMFSSRAAAIVFAALLAIQTASKPVDTMVLFEELKASRQIGEIGGMGYLVQVSGRMPTTAQAAYFIDKVLEFHTLRELIRTATGAIESCYNYGGDLPELLSGVEQGLAKIMESGHGRAPIPDCTTDPTFETYPKRRNPLNLLGGEGALQRGKAMEWVGMTGTGKSSSIMDAAMSWCRGVDFLGMISHGDLKILVLQSEDGPDVISKLVVSYFAHHRLSEPEKNKIRKNLVICEVKGVIGMEFIAIMEQKCKLHRPDLVIINPTGRYIHGSMSDDKTVVEFTSWLDRVNMRCGNHMGIICVAHTPKPPAKAEDRKQTKSTFEMAYNSVGSSQWANYYRNTVYLEPRKERGRFWFNLAKGSELWGIRREYVIRTEGKVSKVYEPVHRVAGKFSTETLDIDGEARPMIVWEADTDEPAAGEKDPNDDVAGVLGLKFSGFHEADILCCYPASTEGGMGLTEINRKVAEAFGVSEETVRKWRPKLMAAGSIAQGTSGWRRTAAGDALAAKSAAGKLKAEDEGL